jgi:hypothetical protein
LALPWPHGLTTTPGSTYRLIAASPSLDRSITFKQISLEQVDFAGCADQFELNLKLAQEAEDAAVSGAVPDPARH